MSAASPDGRHATWQELLAPLSLWHIRVQRRAILRWLAAASIPVWLQALFGRMPDLVVFWGLTVQGACSVLVVAFALLERRWRRRAAWVGLGAGLAAVHAPWTTWDEVRSALWQALAWVCLVPWTYLTLARPMPVPLVSALVGVGATTLLLLVVAETIPRRLGQRAPTG